MSGREQLVQAARELLWERGYSATSPRAIQARAGVGQGSMYHHFTGKEALAGEAMRRNAEELQQSTLALIAAATSPWEAVLDYVRRPRAALRGCRLGRMTQDAEVLDSAEVLEPITRTLGWYRTTLSTLLRQAQEAGDIRADVDTDAVAASVVAMVQGAHVLARADGSPATFDLVVAGAVTLLQSLRVP